MKNSKSCEKETKSWEKRQIGEKMDEKKTCVRDRNPKQDYQKIYMNKGGKWMKSNKSMNENIKKWTNK